MGECGCGETNILEAYAVGGNVLGVEVYRGCSDCGTGPAVTLHMMTREQAAEYDVKVKGEFAPGEHGWDRRQFPLVGPEDLAQAAREIEEAEGPLTDAYGSLEDLFRDRGLKLLQLGLRIREKEEAARAGRDGAAQGPASGEVE